MGYAVKGMALLFALTLQVAYPQIMPLEVAGLLLLAALFIIREKYINQPLLMTLEAGLIYLLATANPQYIYLYCVTAYDLSALGMQLFSPLVILTGLLVLPFEYLPIYLLLLVISGISGYQSYTLKKKESSFRTVYDQERQLRFVLEDAKGKLLGAAREAAHLAEIQERNRIAREIHDSIGHNLAGILLQLQVVQKFLQRDLHKAEELLQQSVTGLASSVDLLRDTVHNIKPRELLGLDYVQKVISNFQFCPVDFSHSGNFALLSPTQIEIISSIIKEGLTNAAKHSQATHVEIKLDIHDQITRLYFKDNGLGCERIHEGLGISGMKERVRYVGGTISFSGKNGFMLVCVLPRVEGGDIVEGLNRR